MRAEQRQHHFQQRFDAFIFIYSLGGSLGRRTASPFGGNNKTMAYANEKRISVSINTSTSGDNEIIAAPGANKILFIDFLMLNPNGGAQTLTIKSGSTTKFLFVLDDNQPFTMENAIHDPEGIITCAVNAAFNLNLSAATQVTGYVKYRISNN